MNFLYSVSDISASTTNIIKCCSWIIPSEGSYLISFNALALGSGVLLFSINGLMQASSLTYDCRKLQAVVFQQLLTIKIGDEVGLHVSCKDKKSMFNLYNNSIQFTLISNPIKKCTCEIGLLMNRGCQCSGI